MSRSKNQEEKRRNSADDRGLAWEVSEGSKTLLGPLNISKSETMVPESTDQRISCD